MAKYENMMNRINFVVLIYIHSNKILNCTSNVTIKLTLLIFSRQARDACHRICFLFPPINIFGNDYEGYSKMGGDLDAKHFVSALIITKVL